MKQKKLVFVFLSISISLIMVLPILNLALAYKQNRLNQQFFSKQQLFSTDHFEAVMNYAAYKLFHISLNSVQVIAGKEDYFFLGNSFVGIVDKSKGTYPYRKQDVDLWTTKLKKLQDWYESQGIEFVFVIASNKQTVYSDKLPDDVVYKEGGTITDDIEAYALKKGVHLLNLKKVLRSKKQDKDLFFHTDTHWNAYGAMLGYLETIRYLNKTYRQHYQVPEYSIKEVMANGGGDLTRFLKINDFLSDHYEKNYQFEFSDTKGVCYGKITKTFSLDQCTPGDKHKFNQYTVNAHAPNKKKLLYLCDSFGIANTVLYQETFQTVWRIHHAFISTNDLSAFVLQNKPDIVIYQIVERDVDHHYRLEEMAQID